MSAIREEELNMVNGGNIFDLNHADPKFHVGDIVVVTESPEYGLCEIKRIVDYGDFYLYSISTKYGMQWAYEEALSYPS